MYTLLKFWAPWCAPCKNYAPTVDKISEEFSEVLTVTNVNIDDNPQERKDWHIMSIPTVILIRDGKELDRKIGSEFSYGDLKDWIDGFIGDLQS